MRERCAAIRRGPSSATRYLVIPSNAPLAEAYAACLGMVKRPCRWIRWRFTRRLDERISARFLCVRELSGEAVGPSARAAWRLAAEHHGKVISSRGCVVGDDRYSVGLLHE